MTGFLSNIIQDKINLNLKYKSFNITSSHSEYMMKILNGMQSDKAKFVIENEIKLLDRGDHPVLRSANLIATRELILNMLH